MKVLQYKDLNYQQLNELNREKTIFLWAVSPIEVHGPHLPLDTDVMVAEELQKRYIEALSKEYSDLTFIIIPSLCLGANSLPVKGSISISPRSLEDIVYCHGKGLADQGFRYMFISDNHGGPGHQLAIQAAAEKLWKKYRFYSIDPFGLVFRKMMDHEEEFLKKAGVSKGCCGDSADSHAGTNETSLALAIDKDRVKQCYSQLHPSLLPPVKGGPALVKGVSSIFSLIGLKELSRDVGYLTNTLSWISDKDMVPYMGNPGLASKEAGESMLKARVEVAMELFRKALRGERVIIKPILWSLRIIRKFSK